MLKSFFLFIKSHVVATLIIATVVVGIVVTASMLVDNYMLDKKVKENLSMLVPSNFQADISQDADGEKEDNSILNTDEPLTFRIEKIYSKDGGILASDTHGDYSDVSGSESIEYKIVPSYDKDYSKWTNEEKRAYQKAYEDAARMAEEDYKKAQANEQNAMANAILNIQKVEQSYSREYVFSFTKDGMLIESESWQYNSFTKLYTGSASDYSYIEKLSKRVRISGSEFIGVTKDDFRNIAYPSLKQKIENSMELKIERQKRENPAMFENIDAENEFMDELKKEKEEALNNLEELYHLSD